MPVRLNFRIIFYNICWASAIDGNFYEAYYCSLERREDQVRFLPTPMYHEGKWAV